MEDHHAESLDRLRAVLRGMDGLLVAFSGGVDSAVVVQVAHEVLGARSVALTAVSETFPPEELDIARRLAETLGIHHVLVESHELEDEGYAKNAGDRCYFCKSELFDLALDRAANLGLAWVADGTITNDLGDHRPGLIAAGERAVRHPLVEAGIDKAAVRAIAKHYGLEVWDKASFACLGSRFPVGTRVTAPRVRMVRHVESFLRLIGLHNFRARWHELEGQPLCRIEVDPIELPRLVEPGVREGLIEACEAEGFRWVTLDLAGYQRGALSAAVPTETAPTETTPPLASVISPSGGLAEGTASIQR
jgi:pyridinium-3,5-biscarboxylic acid mononucleotide sulfurtransferase